MVRELVSGQVMKYLVCEAKELQFYCTGNGEPSGILNNGIIDQTYSLSISFLDWVDLGRTILPLFPPSTF